MATVGQYELDSYTKLLLHLDESTFKDECGNTISNNGVIFDSTTKKFGAGSAKITSSQASYLLASGSESDWDFGGGDFTIDFQLYVTSNSNTTSLIRYGISEHTVVTPFHLYLENNKIRVYMSFDNANWNVGPVYSPAITLNNFNHVAMVRSGSAINFYLNGVSFYNYTTASPFIAIAYPLVVGSVSNGFDGYIDEVRVSKGIARWTSDFNPKAPINLIAVAGDSQVTLSWTAVDGATSYNVKRSTTAGGTYTTIASNVTGTSYVDTSVTNGTTYYYVVTAVNADGESSNSNEASATPEGIRLLRITMNDSSEREYQVTSSEADKFIAWCNRTVDTGTAYYIFNKVVGSQNSKEYLFFEKIISFEVFKL